MKRLSRRITVLLFWMTGLGILWVILMRSLTIYSDDLLLYSDTSVSYKARLSKEEEYQMKLNHLNKSELESLNKIYHRMISIQYARALLPAAAPPYDIKCLTYFDMKYEATVSIVITYYNEVMILLLRSLTTLIHRTPAKYLLEVILIDDSSTVDESGEMLEYARALRIPVRFFRTSSRKGVTNARRFGITQAKGTVVVIFDSHTEVGENWLQPLLYILHNKPNSIAVPFVHMIKEAHYEETPPKKFYMIGLQYGYGVVGFYGELYEPKYAIHLPIKSPALLGGALASLKSTLVKYYPIGIVGNSWGAENSRLSIRAWLCAEGIYLSRCSYVKHPNGLDESLSRYFSEEDKLWERLQEEIIGEVINYVSSKTEKELIIRRFAAEESIAKRIKAHAKVIRENFSPSYHNCNKYDWYLDNVHHNFIPRDSRDSIFVGEVQSLLHENLCMEVATEMSSVFLVSCIGDKIIEGSNSLIQFGKNRCVRSVTHNKCFDSANNNTHGAKLLVFSCHTINAVDGEPGDSQKIVYDPITYQIVHIDTYRCIDCTSLGISDPLILTKCDTKNKGQMWKIRMAPWV